MDGILDSIRKWCDFREKRNEWSALTAGLLFSIGWWLIIDVGVVHGHDFNGTFYICGILATIALLMVNSVKNEQLSGDYYSDGCCGPQTARLWLLTGFIIGFSAVIASLWILIQYFIVEQRHIYPGVALFLQNGLIFGSAIVLKYCRNEEQ